MPSVYHEVAVDHGVAEEEMRDKERLLEDFSNLPPVSLPSFSSKFPIYVISRLRDSDFWIIRERLCQGSKRFAELPTRHPVTLHFSLIAIYSTIFLILSVWSVSLKGQHAVVYSMFYLEFLRLKRSFSTAPAEGATVREARTLSVKINQTSNIYNGAPSPALDEAWDSLFHHANIRVSKAEIDRVGRPSIELADGSGDFFGTLDVYHQLHCLYIHQDYYTMKKTNVPNEEHVDHCIEMLRQVIMCKADTALMTYEWLPDFPGPWPNFGIQHECVDWERLDKWSQDRSIDVFDPIYLQHPKFGNSPFFRLLGLC
ncbi:tat pathway signal sequence protein [Rutstroemia sp. NJR-2017a WRK4]|nr:tat pathway signal sequence protein [Rutstroemia sp. NJR-2017a WRK4]